MILNFWPVSPPMLLLLLSSAACPELYLCSSVYTFPCLYVYVWVEAEGYWMVQVEYNWCLVTFLSGYCCCHSTRCPASPVACNLLLLWVWYLVLPHWCKPSLSHCHTDAPPFTPLSSCLSVSLLTWLYQFVYLVLSLYFKLFSSVSFCCSFLFHT